MTYITKYLVIGFITYIAFRLIQELWFTDWGFAFGWIAAITYMALIYEDR